MVHISFELQALVFNNFILLCSVDTGNGVLREQVVNLSLVLYPLHSYVRYSP